MIKKIIWLLFLNDDDGIYGPDRIMGHSAHNWWRAIRWWLRNPFHNLTHYVIGIKGKDFISYVWKFGVLSFALRHYKWLWLPYVKLEWGIVAYIGWRSSGAFGFKLRKGK